MTTTETEIEKGIITMINMIDVKNMMDHQKLKELSGKIQLEGE